MPEPIVMFRPSVVALAASTLLLVGCQRQAEPPATQSAPSEKPAPVVAVGPAPILDRAALLQAMDVAASAYAAGRDPGGATLAGRRFVVRQTFGCAESVVTPPDGVAGWSWGERRQTLKLNLAPADWRASPLLAGGADGWEAAEGFWLPRPWLRQDGCSGVLSDPAAADTPPASPQTVGLAAVFEEGGSRLGRRNGRAYEFVVRTAGDAPTTAPVGGYRLVLEGRMAAFADGRAIKCRADGPDQRPICIGAVQLDRVAFEDAAGQMLSEWRPS
ncbi:hypothetical protein [Brevundimonas sp.]|uniref:hypothetical protein n=1 Tax=Brevundimonas sp. TaxID=1871086 RepID=UPI0028A106F3|nr:hypothetical protein [Brevundimonas sp.]